MTPRAGRLVVAAIAVVAMFGVAAPAFATPTPAPAPQRVQSDAWLTGPGRRIHRGAGGEVDVNVCTADPRRGYAECAAHVRTDLLDDGVQPRGIGTDAIAAPHAALGDNGAYSPAYLQSAYNA